MNLFSPSPALQKVDTRWLFLFGRLLGEATVPGIQGQLNAAVADMAREWPDTHKTRSAGFWMLDRGSSERRGLRTVDLGFDRDRLIVAEFDAASHGYDAERTQRYLDLLSARVSALPGISGVAVADRVPFFIGFDRMTRVWPASGGCESGGCSSYATYAVEPGYFATMGIAFIEGRSFDSERAAGSVVINRALAQKHWPDGGALGQTMRIGDTGTRVTVVGITASLHTRGLDRAEPVLYVPLSLAELDRPMTLVARADAPAVSLVRPVHDAALAVDPNVAMTAVKTMTERSAVQLWPFRTVSAMFMICGALALILATVGLAGVVSHAVSRRMREFGVRMSIGATQWDPTADVLRSSARLLVPGLAVGLAAAAILARLACVALIGVNVLNPLTYVAVALLQMRHRRSRLPAASAESIAG